ncbi:MAG: DUF493 domain-containing protein [Bacteroidetes bacterium]|nr:DUF493 domain-containing protein [Bacteroidota bacterium]
MILDNENQKPLIEYPCEWIYKVIGSDVDKILDAIEEAALGLNYKVATSNISKNGKYFSLSFSVEVPNETVRNIIFEKLNKNPDIKFVL